MSTICREIREKLFEMQDLGYRDFQAKLMPTVDKERIIGVRIPALRKYAKQLRKRSECGTFLEELPHRYYEEDNLHGFLLEQEKDYESCLEAMERFLPYMDNWATCDLVSPKVFGEHKEELTKAIDRWLSSEETYTVRYGINMLIRYFLKEDFRPEYLERVAKIRSEEYYVRMAVAWYFATALTEQYEAALPFIEKKCLEPWTHNKAIQKARESLQIEKSRKEYLSRLKK